MSVEVDAGTATFTEIVEAMDFSIACEHPAHDVDPEEHEGDADWLVHLRCSGCGDGVEVTLCDKWKRNLDHGYIECGGCGFNEPAKVWRAKQTWIKL